MIKVIQPNEPDCFDEKVRRKGNAMLARKIKKLGDLSKLTSKDFKNYWSVVLPELRRDFKGLCAYSATIVPGAGGEVDHYISKKNAPLEAYEWSNYRFASHDMNKRKANYDDKILDPYQIETGWLELNEKTFEIEITDSMPTHMRKKAMFTIKQLGLNSDQWINSRIIAAIQVLNAPGDYRMLKMVGSQYPLVARAVEKLWLQMQDERLPVELISLCKKHKIEGINIDGSIDLPIWE